MLSIRDVANVESQESLVLVDYLSRLQCVECHKAIYSIKIAKGHAIEKGHEMFRIVVVKR